MSADILVFLLIGLLGGAHCIGMCGPLVTIYSGRLAERSPTRSGHLGTYEVRQHALFNIGRTASYATIGGVFGLLGGLVYFTTDSVAGYANVVQGSIGILVGLLVISMGAYYLLGTTGGLGAKLHVPGAARITALLVGHVDRFIGGPRIIALGAVHGLLPCPILYPAFFYVFATGSPVTGFVALSALGLGTIPAVFLYGTIVETVDPIHRERLHRALGLMFIVLGYIPLSHGLMAMGVPLPHPEIPIYQPFAGGGHGHH